MSYQIRKVDANQTKIVNHFRKSGATVCILSEIGRGCTDLVVGYNGYSVMAEVKDGSKSPSQRRLTKLEQHFFDTWQGSACIVESVEDADKLLDILRGWPRCPTIALQQS